MAIIKIKQGTVLSGLLMALMLAGCAGPQKPVSEPPAPESKQPMRITPVTLKLTRLHGDSLKADYLDPLLNTLSQNAFYRQVNSYRLKNSYTYNGVLNTGSAPRLVQLYKHNERPYAGFVTTSASQMAVANAFTLENTPQGTLYALILKQTRICLVTQAGGAPRWEGGRLRFANPPGYFECTGMTNSSLFQPGSSLPAMLGPYYSEGDTVLVFRDYATLSRMMSALHQRFPEIRIPDVNR